jgi:hypothetical protein
MEGELEVVEAVGGAASALEIPLVGEPAPYRDERLRLILGLGY